MAFHPTTFKQHFSGNEECQDIGGTCTNGKCLGNGRNKQCYCDMGFRKNLKNACKGSFVLLLLLFTFLVGNGVGLFSNIQNRIFMALVVGTKL